MHDPDSFTKRYNLHRLVWFEPHADAENAITHEKRLKKWRREWKLRLIEVENRIGTTRIHVCHHSTVDHPKTDGHVLPTLI